MSMKVAYVAGPYRHKLGAWHISQHIEVARRVAGELWAQGYAVICPHTNTAHFDGVAPDETFLEGGLEILRRCDLVVLAPGWPASSGTAEEIKLARELKLPIFAWPFMDEPMVWESDRFAPAGWYHEA